MIRDYRTSPVVLATLAHTGRLDGDDKGYREVPVSDLDETDPDPMVILNNDVACVPIYAIGAVPEMCPYYGKGIGADKRIVVREPVRQGLLAVNELLKPYDRELVCLDGGRLLQVQANMFSFFYGIFGDKLDIHDDSIQSVVRVGLEADVIGAYARFRKDAAYIEVVKSLPQGELIDTVASLKGTRFEGDVTTPEEAAHYWATFMANLTQGFGNMTLDEDTQTAHGGGGAADCFMRVRSTGKLATLGCQFENITPVIAIDWFEKHTVADYQTIVAAEPDMQAHLNANGIFVVGPAEFEMIRENRRILTGAMVEAGATFYYEEPWHWNLGSERGGKHNAVLPGGGSSCHSLLKNVCGPNGKPLATWGNRTGQRLMRELLAA